MSICENGKMQNCKYDFHHAEYRPREYSPNAISIPFWVLPPKDSCALQIVSRIGEVVVEKMFNFGRSSGDVRTGIDLGLGAEFGRLFFKGLGVRSPAIPKKIIEILNKQYIRMATPLGFREAAPADLAPERPNSTLWETTFGTSYHSLHQHANAVEHRFNYDYLNLCDK